MTGQSKIKLLTLTLPIAIGMWWCTTTALGQTFSPEEQRQLDSLNAIINNPTSHDTSLANAFVGLSDILYVSNLDTMIPLCTKAKDIAEKALSAHPPTPAARSLKVALAGALNNIGFIHDNQGDIPLALEYYHKALKTAEEIGDKQMIATVLANIGSLQLKESKALGLSESSALARARENGERGLAIALELGFPDQIARNAGLLTKVAKREGNYKEALEMYELQVVQLDSMKNEETQKAAIRQQMKYEYEKAQIIKEQKQKEEARLQAEALQRRDNLQYSIILIAILLVFGAVMGLGFVKVSPRVAEGMIFFAFLILFEFLLVLSDPYLETLTGGAPAYKFLANALLAALIFPAHSFFERVLKKRLIDMKRKNKLKT